MTDDPSMADPLGPIVEQFTNDVRQGKSPRIDEYAERFPEYADQLRQMLPVLAMMEKAKEETAGPFPSRAGIEVARRGTLGGYRIFREIGRGGMGVVYEAEQESLGRHVALKVLPQHMSVDPQMVQRFQREARAAAQLHHTNIVPVFEIGQEDETYFYAMQFIRGLSLDEVLNQVRQLKAKESNATSQDTPSAPLSAVAHSLWTGAFSGDAPVSSRFDVPFNDSLSLQDDPLLPLTQRSLKSPLTHEGNDRGFGQRARDLAREPEDRIKSILKQATIFSAPQRASDAPRRNDSSSARLPGKGDLSIVDSKFDYYARSVARVGQQVANALSYAHERGIIHRDIKPSNLLLDAAGVVWMTDFGLAKTVEDGLTRTGHMLGTLRYMAPERFHGGCDAESDIYSLGITLYEMLTLRPVFESKDRLELIRMISEAEPIRPRTIDTRIPRDLETIVLKAMDKDPRHRYRSASAMAADLENYLNDEPIWARRISPPERLWRWAKRSKGTAAALSTIALLLVLFAVAAGWAANHYRTLVGKQAELATEMLNLAEQQSDMRQASEQERQQAVAGRLEAQRNLYYSQIHVAAQAWESHRGVVRMRNLLEQWRPAGASFDYRGWEWYYLAGLLHKNERTIPVQGHSIVGACFNPRTGDLAAGNEDGLVRVWDPRTGRVTYGYRAHLRDVLSVAWSPNGNLIATSGKDGTLRVHDPAQQTDLPIPQNHTGDVNWVSFSQDGIYLASASSDATVRIWRTSDGHEDAVLAGDVGPLYTVAWSPDGRLLAAAGERGILYVWDRESTELVATLPAHKRAIRALAWSRDGRRIASAGDDQQVQIWDGESRTQVATLDGHSHVITALQWSPDSKQLASASFDQTIRLWDARNSRPVRIFRGHTDRINCVAWSGDGSRLVSAGYDRMMRLWDPTTELESLTYRGHDGSYAAAAAQWDPRGNRVASAAADDSVHIWDPATGDLLFDLVGHEGAVTSLAWHPTTEKLATAGADGTIRVWNIRTGGLIQTVKKYDGRASVVCFDPQGSRLAAGGDDGRVIILEGETLKELLTIQRHTGAVHALAWNPNGQEIASAGEDNLLRICDPATGDQKWEFDAETDLRSLAWSPKGSALATGCGDFSVRVWDVATKQLQHRLVGHSDLVLDVAWSSTGDRLVSGSVDGTLRIWDVNAGAETLTISGHDRSIGAVDWSSDGMRIVSASEDSTVRVWDAVGGYEGQRSQELLTILNRRIDVNPANISDLELRRRLQLFFGKNAEARKDRQRIIELYEAQLKEGQYIGGVAERLATILMDSDDEWLTIDPTVFRSQGGATLIPQPDHSVMVEGFNPDWDVYTIQGRVDLERITAVRLEAIPDSRLPGGGSGRFSANGNFHLSEIRARGILASNANPAELYFIRAVSDFSPREGPIENAIDSDIATTWNIWPSQTDRHGAVFELSDAWTIPNDGEATIELALEFHHPYWMSHNLGRFRLSVTAWPRPVLREQLRVDLQAGRLDSRIRLAGAYYLVGEFAKAEGLLAESPANDPGDDGYGLVLRALVSRELKRDNAASLRRDAAEWLKSQSSTRGFVIPMQLPE